MQSVSLTSQFVLVLICAAIVGAAIAARGDARPAKQVSSYSTRTATRIAERNRGRDRGRNADRIAVRQKTNLPETRVLQEHDDLLPTQNRTQAMVLESEYGHLPAQEDQVLKSKGYLKKAR